MIQTLEQPELGEDDARPRRVRYFRRCGPERWLRVVVEWRKADPQHGREEIAAACGDLFGKAVISW